MDCGQGRLFSRAWRLQGLASACGSAVWFCLPCRGVAVAERLVLFLPASRCTHQLLCPTPTSPLPPAVEELEAAQGRWEQDGEEEEGQLSASDIGSMLQRTPAEVHGGGRELMGRCLGLLAVLCCAALLASRVIPSHERSVSCSHPVTCICLHRPADTSPPPLSAPLHYRRADHLGKP